MQLRAFLLSGMRKTGKSILPPMRAAVKLQFPLFLLSQRRKTGISILPPMGAAVNLQLPAGEEENGKINFTADASSGNVVIAGFPPLRVEENWKMRVYLPRKQR